MVNFTLNRHYIRKSAIYTFTHGNGYPPPPSFQKCAKTVFVNQCFPYADDDDFADDQDDADGDDEKGITTMRLARWMMMKTSSG